MRAIGDARRRVEDAEEFRNLRGLLEQDIDEADRLFEAGDQHRCKAHEGDDLADRRLSAQMQPDAKQENRQNRQRRRGAAGDGDEGPPGENRHLRRDDVIDDAVQRMRLAFDARKALHHRDVAKRIGRMFGERRIVALDLALQIFRASQDEARHEIKDHDKRHEQRAEPPIDEQRRRQEHEERNEGRAVLAKERQPQPRHGVRPVEHDL